MATERYLVKRTFSGQISSRFSAASLLFLY